jgi:hypothetical protein
MLVILQVEFLVGIICHTFGQFTVEDWEPFHSISVSLTVADCCSLAGVHIWTLMNKPLQRMEFARGTDPMRQLVVQLLEFGHFKLSSGS